MDREIIVKEWRDDKGLIHRREIGQELVRCKACKHAHMTYDGLCKYCDTWEDDDGNLLELYLDGDYYCADGEREGE